jgi:hypothetical protein
VTKSCRTYKDGETTSTLVSSVFAASEQKIEIPQIRELQHRTNSITETLNRLEILFEKNQLRNNDKTQALITDNN